MYLRYCSNSKITPLAGFELLWFLINNPSITTIAELIAHPSWVSGTFLYNHPSFLVPSRSELVRTSNPTNVQAHRYLDTTGGLNAVTLRFQSYDSSSQKYFIQCFRPVNTQHTIQVGTGTSPSFDTALTAASGTASRMTLSEATTWVAASTDEPYDQHFLLTNNCLVYSWNGEFAGSLTGWGNSANRGVSSLNGHGPWIAAQYSRYDYFNNAGNGIVPLMLSTGFVTTYNPVYGLAPRHFNTALNPTATNLEVPFRVLHTRLNNYGGGFTLNTNQPVHMGVGCRSSDGIGAALTVTNTSTTANTQTYGRSLTMTAGERYPSIVSNYGYALLPLWWQYSTHYMAGGSVSDQSDLWIFNGDFYAGDEITANGKTYVLWPIYGADSNRVALAVPKV